MYGCWSYWDARCAAAARDLIGWVPVCLGRVGLSGLFTRAWTSASVLLWGAWLSGHWLVAIAVWAGRCSGPVFWARGAVFVGFDSAAWSGTCTRWGAVLAWRYFTGLSLGGWCPSTGAS